MSEPVPLTDDQITDGLAALGGWARFILTTHDAEDKITARDLEMAAHIDAIAAGHGAKPVPPETT